MSLSEAEGTEALDAHSTASALMVHAEREFESWKTGLLHELKSYEERGNSKMGLVLTVLAVFVVAFHVELYALHKHLTPLVEKWWFEWTLYCQQKQRQWRRLKRKRAPVTSRKKNSSFHPFKHLASPTSTASTVEAEAESSHSAKSPKTNLASASGHRGRTLLMMKNLHRPISPRPSPEKPRVLRDNYGNKIPTYNRNSSLRSNKSISPPPLRSQSMGHGSQRSHFSSPSHSSNRSNRSNNFLPTNNLLDSQDLNSSRVTQTSSLLSLSAQNLSSSTINSKDTRSTNTPSRTPSERSHVTPNPDTPTSNSEHSHPYTNSATFRKMKRTNSMGRASQPPEAAPMRRANTADGATINHRRRRKKNNSNTVSSAPLSQARRRMSGGGAAAERAAGLSRNADDRQTFARQMHPRSRSGNGAMTTTASQMYMMRQPSQSARSGTYSNDGTPTRSMNQRSKSGLGATSPNNRSRSRTPKGSRGHSPLRTPPSTGYRGNSSFRLTGELSRQDLGYE